MYEFAKMIQEEKRRQASHHRLAQSLPHSHSWSIGRYRLTIAKAPEGSLPSSTVS